MTKRLKAIALANFDTSRFVSFTGDVIYRLRKAWAKKRYGDHWPMAAVAVGVAAAYIIAQAFVDAIGD